MLDDHDFAIFWLRQVRFALQRTPDPSKYSYDSASQMFVPIARGGGDPPVSTSQRQTSHTIAQALRATRVGVAVDGQSQLPTLTDVHAHGIIVAVRIEEW